MSRRNIHNSDSTLLDSIVEICEEKIPNAGEDSYFYKTEGNTALISVFDGCGGAGGKEYERFGGKTGAYIASRAVSGAVCSWCEPVDRTTELDENELRDTLRGNIDLALDTCRKHCGNNGVTRMKGSMAKEFPTTAAIALCVGKKDRVNATLFWVGDSRVYLLDGDGLAQLTEDDLDGIDAFENISSDGVLTNVISASGEYTLHSRELSISLPCILFSATDGCFGYIQTPMQFEYLLLECLYASNSISEWETLLNGSFGKVAGDDYSFVAALYGYGSFEQLKTSFSEREEYMYHTYIEPLQHADDEAVKALWRQYSTGYYRHIDDFNRR